MPLSILTFVMPNAIGDDKAAGIIQARARGYLVRRHITSTEHEGSDDVDAAVLIQAAVRGKLARRRMSAAAAAPMQDGPASDDMLASPGMRMHYAPATRSHAGRFAFCSAPCGPILKSSQFVLNWEHVLRADLRHSITWMGRYQRRGRIREDFAVFSPALP